MIESGALEQAERKDSRASNDTVVHCAPDEPHEFTLGNRAAAVQPARMPIINIAAADDEIIVGNIRLERVFERRNYRRKHTTN
jgi:hypothetical protein